MLERILIQNFQTHSKLRVDFDPAITCIVGPTDVGKSAILRALRWVTENQPGGDTFVRYGAKGCTVQLLVDGHTIVRRRSPGGGTNTYSLDDAEYKAFGRGVPEPVEALLNIGPICWQRQHDAPYWFSETAGEVSRQLNSIVNLGIIDDSLTNINRAFHKARTRLEVVEEDLTAAKCEADGLAWVPGFADAVNVLADKETRWAVAASRAARFRELLLSIQAYQAACERATRANSRGLIMAKCGETAVNAANRVESLKKLVDVAKVYQRAASVVVPSFTLIEEIAQRYRDAAVEALAVRALVKDIKEKETILCQRKEELKKAEAAVPKVCPTCGQSLPPTSICKHGPR